MNAYVIEYDRWLNSDLLSLNEREELRVIFNDEKEKEFRFYAPMSFGTAGLRSTMGVGLSMMNRFTVANATKALAKLVKEASGEMRGVAIAYDSRNNSEQFAKISASILAYEGIKVYLFDGLRPTPELSFAVRKLNLIAGINITASHNPKEYNGFKVYWEDGAQISPEQAERISEARKDYDVLDESGSNNFTDYLNEGKIILLSDDFDNLYLDAVIKTSLNSNYIKSVSDELKIVYSPLHGAGYKLVPALFNKIGLKHLYTVDEQMIPDGDFPTVKKPNPENIESFAIGIKLANKVDSDIVIATDPDSDRVGVVARNKDGEFVAITGNQMGSLLLDYVIKERKRLGLLRENSYCVKSFVSTDMATKIADQNGVKIHDVFTGFKFIGEVIKKYEDMGQKDGFLLGFEESYGYLLGTYARDKDAVETSMIILEMIAYYKKIGMTLCDALSHLYDEYGQYSEKTIDIYMEALDGIAKRRETMKRLRDDTPKAFGNIPVKEVYDYLSSIKIDLQKGIRTPISNSTTDALYFVMDNDDKIIIRPSGTEPKIKIYLLSHAENRSLLENKIENYTKDVLAITNI